MRTRGCTSLSMVTTLSHINFFAINPRCGKRRLRVDEVAEELRPNWKEQPVGPSLTGKVARSAVNQLTASLLRSFECFRTLVFAWPHRRPRT